MLFTKYTEQLGTIRSVIDDYNLMFVLYTPKFYVHPICFGRSEMELEV